MDEEKKVEAVRDFYDNAVGDDVAVERLQAIGVNLYVSQNWIILNQIESICSARIWVPASVLAFSILYWGYGLSFFFEMM